MSEQANQITAQLSEPVRLKTWSLLVTIFGDAILPHGGNVSAQTLNEITGAMGVNAGAVRTALSRLAGEGIIERRREGRGSLYRLSPDREQEFIAAADRIYNRRDDDGGAGNHMLVAAPGGQSPVAGALRLSREWWLVHDRAVPDLPGDAAVFEGRFSRLPEWMIGRVASPELEAAMHLLKHVFAPARENLEREGAVEGLEAVAIRCLLIHAWRRIALRLQPLPQEFTPRDWPEAECRDLVGQLYRLLQPPSDAWLAERLGSDINDVSARRFA